jgi:tetratricopeptide (TPR) repeat protein
LGARHLLIAVLATALGGGAPAHAGQDTRDPALAAAPEEVRAELTRLETEALARIDAGEPAQADALLEQLLVLELRVYGPDHPLVANTHAFRADLAERGGDLARAEVLRRLELPVREEAGDPLALAEARRALGALLVATDRHGEAVALLEPAHAVMAAQLAAADDRRISAAHNLGRSYYRLERVEDAMAVLAPAAQTLMAPGHDASLWAPLVAHEYGFILAEQGRHEEAVPFLSRACDLWRPSGGAVGWPGEACFNVAESLMALGRHAETGPWLEHALEDPNLSAGRRSNAVEHLVAMGTADDETRVDEALLRAALDASTEAWGADHGFTAYAANRLGVWLRNREQRNEEALAVFDQAQAAYFAAEGPAGEGVMTVTASLAYTLVALDRAEEAVTRAEAVQQGIDPDALEDAAARRAWRSLAWAKTAALRAADRIDESRRELTRLADWLAAGDGSPAQLADVQTALAQAAARQLDWPAMVEHRRLALAYRQQVDDPRGLAMAIAHYGQVLGETGEVDAAYRNLGEALTLHTTVEDATEDERLYVMLNFGVAARRLGRLNEAEPLLEIVVARRRDAGEPSALSFALNQLGDLRVDQNRFDEAESLYLEALALVEDDAEAVSFIHTDLGELWRFMGRIDEAEAALRRVVDYTASRHGPGSIQNATPLRNLANHLNVTGRKERALDMLLQVQALEEAYLPPESLGRLTTASQIGAVLTDLGRFAEAERIFVPTVELAMAHLGGESRVTQRAAAQLGFVATQQGRYDEAVELLSMTADLTERSFGPEGREMINVLQLLSYALYMEGRYQDAIAVLTRTERIVDAQGARWPSTIVDVKGNLGRTYVEAGRPREALAPLRQAVTLAARLTSDQVTASGSRARINRAPFRTLVDAAWGAADPR